MAKTEGPSFPRGSLLRESTSQFRMKDIPALKCYSEGSRYSISKINVTDPVILLLFCSMCGSHGRVSRSQGVAASTCAPATVTQKHGWTFSVRPLLYRLALDTRLNRQSHPTTRWWGGRLAMLSRGLIAGAVQQSPRDNPRLAALSCPFCSSCFFNTLSTISC